MDLSAKTLTCQGCAEFTLLDSNQRAITVKQLTLSTASGIIGVQIDQPLAINRSYQWVFSILADPNSPSQNPVVEGIVRRVAPNAQLSAALDRVSNQRERVAVLAQHGIWHNALTHLADLRRAEPTNLMVVQDWSDFLGSVGLGAIANESLLN
ncbi:MAG: DUF928 domain-containing protein [Cyanothece sp. SIO1E1]|nr:DUF928 domain-containing protein [Cyanothece sp. SIO1E1]